MDRTWNLNGAIEGVHYRTVGGRIVPIVSGGDGPAAAPVDRRNLPPEVLARLAEHEDLDAAVSVIQRGRIVEGRSTPIELRTDENGNPVFEGYATVYDHAYQVGGTYGWAETIVRGAADKSVAERDDVRLLLNHDGIPLARTASGTLTLNSELVGLRCGPDALDGKSPLVQMIASAMSRGAEGQARRDLDEMSLAFQVIRQEWNGDYTERRILELKLFDVSIVTYPANPAATALLRSVTLAAAPPAATDPSRSLALALAEDELLALRRP